MNGKILFINGITKRFGGLVALEDVRFDVSEGEIVGLMGPNGAGKTTLLNIISGEDRPNAGRIQFRGRDITNAPPYHVCHLGIARTYQIPQPFIKLSVKENLRVSAIFGRPAKRSATFLDHDKILELAGLSEKGEMLAGNLSVMSLKRLELARALACRPDMILLDEVAAGSTEAEIPQILTTLKEIKRLGIAVIIVEHVMKVLVNAVDRLIVIDKGRKIAEGDPTRVMSDPCVIESYFGA